jgi:hypothetical protein
MPLLKAGNSASARRTVTPLLNRISFADKARAVKPFEQTTVPPWSSRQSVGAGPANTSA